MLNLAAMLLTSLILGAEHPVLALSLNTDGFEQHTQGAWRVRYDHRDLLAMRHAWKPSEEGGFGAVSYPVGVPDDWDGPIALSFYCSDDYHTDSWRPDGSWLSAEGFIGHRFKRILVDGKVIWNQDVADPVGTEQSSRFRVPLPVKAGQRFLLTLLVYDAVPSSTVLPGDFYQAETSALKRDADPDASNFATSVYWGDLALIMADAALDPGKRPSEGKVRELHASRWPLPAFGDPWARYPVTLDISAPAGLPKEGFPVQSGVPIHMGKLKAPDYLVLQDQKQKPFPAQKTVLAYWPDDSIQWTLLEFPAIPTQSTVEMGFGADKTTFPKKIQVKEMGSGFDVLGSGLGFSVRPDRLIDNIRAKPTEPGAGLTLNLQTPNDVAHGIVESSELLEDGPFRCTVALQGRFDTVDMTVASFAVYCSAYAGLPYLKLLLRIDNDSTTDLPVVSLPLRLSLPAAPENVRVPSGEVAPGFALSQVSEKSRQLNGVEVDPQAPMYLAWKGGTLVVRQFRELYPKKASAEGTDLTLDLIAAGDHPIVFTPGEAKSHEIWLALGSTDPVQFAATVNTPPILQNAAYFCASGVLGPAAPHEGVSVLHDHMTSAFGEKRWEDFGQAFGVRDFPDSPYQGGLPNWSNNYYERMLNLWSEWFISGDRRWYDLATDTCRHIMDVAIVHSEVPGQDWRGAMHGPGRNHVAGPWNPTLRPDGLALYYQLTGAPGVNEAVLGVADFCMRTKAGNDAPSARQQAAPFDAICTAYLTTGDVKYLDEGTERVASVLRAMDRRRGVWSEVHGSSVYRGNVPWMIAQVGRPLYRWYRATGDLEAAQALVGLAESILCEDSDWDAPGLMSDYSHNPHFAATSVYDPLIVPIIFAAYELTDDAFFLDAAKAQWERWKRERAFDSPMNGYWNTPWLVWYLKKYQIEGMPAPAGTSEAPANDK